MSISFGGIGEMCVTMKTSGTVAKGSPVKLCANGTVTACSAGDRLVGVVVDKAEDGYATVQLAGFAEVGYTGTAPSVGFGLLGADGSGGVKTVASGGGEYVIVTVDTAAKTVGFII